jgi:hypothetical protein
MDNERTEPFKYYFIYNFMSKGRMNFGSKNFCLSKDVSSEFEN